MPVHIVKQGECMNTIADQYGFFWHTLWNHDKNAEIKKNRKNPNVLMAGDQVFIPAKRPKVESVQTGQVYNFRMKGVPVRLNLQLLDLDNSPRTGTQYTMTIDGKETTGTVGKDGVISVVVPPQAKSGKLVLDTGEEYELDLGHMNPIEYTSGVQARLKNLGYLEGEISGTLDDETRDAIRSFQRDHDLEATGEPDSATQAALLEAHQG